jgi:hypothetical protein
VSEPVSITMQVLAKAGDARSMKPSAAISFFICSSSLLTGHVHTALRAAIRILNTNPYLSHYTDKDHLLVVDALMASDPSRLRERQSGQRSKSEEL